MMTIIMLMISTTNYMLGRAIWDKLPECIFKNSKLPEWSEDKFKIFKNQEGDLSQKLLEINQVITG